MDKNNHLTYSAIEVPALCVNNCVLSLPSTVLAFASQGISLKSRMPNLLHKSHPNVISSRQDQ